MHPWRTDASGLARLRRGPLWTLAFSPFCPCRSACALGLLWFHPHTTRALQCSHWLWPHRRALRYFCLFLDLLCARQPLLDYCFSILFLCDTGLCCYWADRQCRPRCTVASAHAPRLVLLVRRATTPPVACTYSPAEDGGNADRLAHGPAAAKGACAVSTATGLRQAGGALLGLDREINPSTRLASRCLRQRCCPPCH